MLDIKKFRNLFTALSAHGFFLMPEVETSIGLFLFKYSGAEYIYHSIIAL